MRDRSLVRDDWLSEWSIGPGIRGAWSSRASGLDFSQAAIWASVSSSINRAFAHIHSFTHSVTAIPSECGSAVVCSGDADIDWNQRCSQGAGRCHRRGSQQSQCKGIDVSTEGPGAPQRRTWLALHLNGGGKDFTASRGFLWILQDEQVLAKGTKREKGISGKGQQCGKYPGGSAQPGTLGTPGTVGIAKSHQGGEGAGRGRAGG